MIDTNLIHYGVKGMKWGRRKNEPISSNKSQRRRRISKTTGMLAASTILASAAVAGVALSSSENRRLFNSAITSGITKVKDLFNKDSPHISSIPSPTPTSTRMPQNPPFRDTSYRRIKEEMERVIAAGRDDLQRRAHETLRDSNTDPMKARLLRDNPEYFNYIRNAAKGKIYVDGIK